MIELGFKIKFSNLKIQICDIKNFFDKIWWILKIESQFCEILQILVHIDFKILEKVLSRLWPHVGTNFGKFWISNFVKIAKLW